LFLNEIYVWSGGMEKKDSIASRLKIARKARGVRQAEISEKIQVSLSTYSSYERGLKYPNSRTIIRFCRLLEINFQWLFTGRGPMFCEENSSELDTELLGKVIERVEEHLQQIQMLISPAKKAEIISILYEETLENQDWQEEIGMDKKTKKFISLLAGEEGSVEVSFGSRLSELASGVVASGFSNTVNHYLSQISETDDSLTREELIDNIIKILERKVDALKVERDKKDGVYISWAIGCFVLLVISMMTLNIHHRFSIAGFFIFVGVAVIAAKFAGKSKADRQTLDIQLNANMELLTGLLRDKIYQRTEELELRRFAEKHRKGKPQG